MIAPLPTTHAAAAVAVPVVAGRLGGASGTTAGDPAAHVPAAHVPAVGVPASSGSRASGGLLGTGAPVVNQQLGAFVRRSIVVAPPRVSVRPAEPLPAAGGPPVPASARGGSRPPAKPGPGKPGPSRPSPQDRHPTTGPDAGAPVIRRSLADTANSLFRSLMRNSGPSAPDPVLAEGNGMFDSSASEPAVIRRFRQPGSDHPEQAAQPDEGFSPAMQARDFDELIDRIVAKLEHRILEDLERRGRRGIPEVF